MRVETGELLDNTYSRGVLMHVSKSTPSAPLQYALDQLVWGASMAVRLWGVLDTLT